MADTSKLFASIANVQKTVDALPATIATEIAAQDAKTQADIDSATASVDNLNTAIQSATAPAAPTAEPTV